MYNWDYIKEQISNIICKHTKKFEPEKIAPRADEIIDAWLDGKAWDEILSNDKSPDEDATNLAKGAAHLDLAISFLTKIGHIGNRALESQSSDRNGQIQTRGSMSNEASYSAKLSNSLRPISIQMQSASKALKSNDLGLIAILSGTNENPPLPKGRKANFTALNVTKACAMIFEDGTSLKATNTRNHYPERASGAGSFYSFVSDIFMFLEIKANAEHFIRQLRSEEIRK